jgi:hypothetical protein
MTPQSRSHWRIRQSILKLVIKVGTNRLKGRTALNWLASCRLRQERQRRQNVFISRPGTKSGIKVTA